MNKHLSIYGYNFDNTTEFDKLFTKKYNDLYDGWELCPKGFKRFFVNIKDNKVLNDMISTLHLIGDKIHHTYKVHENMEPFDCRHYYFLDDPFKKEGSDDN